MCSSRSRILVLLATFLSASLVAAQPTSARESASFRDVVHYIDKNWAVLTRSPEDCRTLTDPKVPTRSVLYLPADQPMTPSLRQLAKRCRTQIAHLPSVIVRLGSIDMRRIQPHGLLYLEHEYVVPGGMFNELYGWDSYFILRGLLRSGRVELARNMVEDFFYEIEHYGAVLNANRTYYLTRSQPPFLTSMVRALYESERQSGKEDREWLARAYSYAVRDYEMWTQEPHLAGNTGLSRYFDFGEGPAPEVEGNDSYYRTVVERVLRQPSLRDDYLVGPDDREPTLIGPRFRVWVCGNHTRRCGAGIRLALTHDYFKGDRSMRESGFDVSFRFGAFGGKTHHYAAVCLNSLLYKTEIDLARFADELGKSADARRWRELAELRRERMTRYLWDRERGMFFDYDFQTGQRSAYEFAATFYPLWAGIASSEQAASVVRNLPRFERAGGIVSSPLVTGMQWDAPYGWAPIQLLAIEGLRRYGFRADADRLSRKFLETVARNFRKDGTIREKYNMETGSSETPVTAGYRTNVVGFGWTNGVFLELLHELEESAHSPWPQ